MTDPSSSNPPIPLPPILDVTTSCQNPNPDLDRDRTLSEPIDRPTLDEKLYAVAKLMNPMYRITPDVVVGLRDFIVLVIERLIHTADIIATYGNVTAICHAELKIAVEIILPSELRSTIMIPADTIWRHYNSTDNPSNSTKSSISANVTALSTSSSSEAELIVVPACVSDLMRPPSSRSITQSAIIYVAAIIETMARDLWTLTGDETTDDGMVVVIPRHLGRAVDKHPVYRRFCNWIAPVD
jgi:hypothetical protein